MSLRTFQRAQVAMVTDGDVARRMAGGDLAPWQEDLTSLEQERLVAQAADAGMALSRTLHKGWRLTKLLTLLPATFRHGDPDLLGDLVDGFWRLHPPQGLYFEAEAARFAAFVADRVPRGSPLHDAAMLEGTLLAVEHLEPNAEVIELHSAHDPRRLLAPGRPPEDAAVGAFDVAVAVGRSGPSLSLRACVGACRVTDAAHSRTGG